MFKQKGYMIRYDMKFESDWQVKHYLKNPCNS